MMNPDGKVPTLTITYPIDGINSSIMLTDRELANMTEWFHEEYDTKALANPTAIYNNAWGDYRNDALLWWFDGQFRRPYIAWDDYGTVLPEFQAIIKYPLRYFMDAVSHNTIVSVDLVNFAAEIRMNARCFVYESGSQRLVIHYTWFVHAGVRYWIWDDVTGQSSRATYDCVDSDQNGIIPRWPATIEDFAQLAIDSRYMSVDCIDDSVIWCLPASEHNEFKRQALEHGLDTGSRNAMTF
jgi:hypothetical protein